jgi:hypothetical protein
MHAHMCMSVYDFWVYMGGILLFPLMVVSFSIREVYVLNHK